ncbi:hypothetical protein JTB14_001045 [Gonioctena quinquepunctata]|nr:hypothetical protein JTB14_001045 [Gonioctena quinquepunctata]
MQRKKFIIKQQVMARDYRSAKPSWAEAVITAKIGRSMYDCQFQDGNPWRRHANHLIQCDLRCEEQTNPQVVNQTQPEKELRNDTIDTDKKNQETIIIHYDELFKNNAST